MTFGLPTTHMGQAIKDNLDSLSNGDTELELESTSNKDIESEGTPDSLNRRDTNNHFLEDVVQRNCFLGQPSSPIYQTSPEIALNLGCG